MMAVKVEAGFTELSGSNMGFVSPATPAR